MQFSRKALVCDYFSTCRMDYGCCELADVTCQYKKFSKYITYSFTSISMCSSIYGIDQIMWIRTWRSFHPWHCVNNCKLNELFYIKCFTHDLPLYHSYVCDTLVINITRYISDDECTPYHNLILHPATGTKIEHKQDLKFFCTKYKWNIL